MVKNFDDIYAKKGPYHFTLAGFSKHWYYENYDIIKEFLGSTQNKRVLDVGCGDGFLTSQLGTTVIGIDRSSEGLKLAKKLTKNNYLLADMRNLPFKDRSLDAIVNSVSIIYINKDELPSLVKEFKRVLISNGKAVISFPNIKDLKRRVYVFLGLELEYRRETIESAPGEISLDILEELFIQEGFKLNEKKGIFVTLPYFCDRLGKYKPLYNFMTGFAKILPSLSHTVVYEFTLN